MRRVVGNGLVALDIVTDDTTGERIGEWAGGSCGNVLAILASFGWEAAPVARLGQDGNAKLVRDDLCRWGVDDRWLALGSPVPVPVFIERLETRDDGQVTHRFDRFCPACGSALPRYQPVPQRALGPVLDVLRDWDVVYIDRPSAGSALLATKASESGNLVVFEPSARGSAAHLEAIASCSDIIKYSSERLTDDDRAVIAAAEPALEIETLGAAGLRYRRRSRWQFLPGFSVRASDTAGAGDWTTAGVLERLAGEQSALGQLNEHKLRDALRFGQALAAWSCGFRGPRGGMERHSASVIRREATALMRGDRHDARRRPSAPLPQEVEWACEACP